MRLRLFLLAAVLFGSLPALAQAEEGRLCPFETALLSAAERTAESCIATTGTTVEISAVDDSRRYAWFSKTSRELEILDVAPDQNRIELARKSAHAFALTLDGSDTDRWPQPVTVKGIASDGTHWAVELTRAEATALNRMRLGRVTTELVISAPHHRTRVRRIGASTDARQLGRIVLQRLPIISGQVLEIESKGPLPGAEVRLPNGELYATATVDGAFNGEIDEWPEYLVVSFPGRGSKTVTVPPQQNDIALPPTLLRRAGTIQVMFNQPRTMSVELSRWVKNSQPLRVTSKELEDADKVTFANVDPGEYYVFVRGDKPLQQLWRRITVREGETTEVNMFIEPLRLKFAVTVGDRGVPAKLEIISDEMLWRGKIATDESGHAVEELWQRGSFGAFVSVNDEHAVMAARRTIDEPEEALWTISLPNRHVRGTVTDAKRHTPVANANVYLETTTDNASTLTSAITDGGGAFKFGYVEPGNHTLSVHAQSYLDGNASFVLFESDSSRVADIQLERAVAVALQATSPSGVPVIGATIVDETANARAPWITDDTGVATIPLRAGERRVVYVLSKDGSFATTMITGDEKAGGTTRLTVPDPNATIKIRAQSASGEPLANVGVLMRYNGFVVPLPVQHLMTQVQGRQFKTGPDGEVVLAGMPQGIYEFWTYFSPREARTIYMGLGAEPQAQLAAVPGLNTIVLSFEPVKQ